MKITGWMGINSRQLLLDGRQLARPLLRSCSRGRAGQPARYLGMGGRNSGGSRIDLRGGYYMWSLLFYTALICLNCFRIRSIFFLDLDEKFIHFIPINMGLLLNK
jgi:hypothetical protein